jgi:hypothetical protein
MWLVSSLPDARSSTEKSSKIETVVPVSVRSITGASGGDGDRGRFVGGSLSFIPGPVVPYFGGAGGIFRAVPAAFLIACNNDTETDQR